MSVEEASPDWTFFFVVVTFAIIFPLFWCGVIWLISQLSGWGALAQRYRTQQTPMGKRWSWQYGMIGWAGYNGILLLTANADGLFMETMWLFRFGNPRLFIPWRDFHDVKVGYYFFQRRVRAKIGLPTIATVWLPAAAFEQSEGRTLLPTQPA
jgi:hypothetical protein